MDIDAGMIAMSSPSSSHSAADYSIAVHRRKALGLTDIKFEAETVDRYVYVVDGLVRESIWY